MTNKILCAVLFGITFALVVTPADATLKVVTTLSTFADIVSTIGGEQVEVSSIAAPKFNPHFIEVRPSDVLKVKRADLFAHAGLDLEPWKPALLDAAGNPAMKPGGDGDINMSHGVRMLNVPDRNVTRAEGDIHLFGNPHYWLSPNNGLIMARTVARRLSEYDPGHTDVYAANLANFESELRTKIPVWKSRVSSHAGQEIVAYHDQWPYLVDFLELRVEHFLESKPGIPPGPKHLLTLANHIKTNGIPVIIMSAMFPSRGGKTLAKRSGAELVILAQAVGEVKEATDYISLIEYNVTALVTALER